MTDAERDKWAREGLNRIRRHRRHVPSGMFAMMDDGLLDALDCLAVAPLVFADGMDEGAVEFEARRAAKLAAVAVNGRD